MHSILYISFGTVLVRIMYPIKKRREKTSFCFLNIKKIKRKQEKIKNYIFEKLITLTCLQMQNKEFDFKGVIYGSVIDIF